MEPHGLPLVGTCSPREESDRRGVEAASRMTRCTLQRASFLYKERLGVVGRAVLCEVVQPVARVSSPRAQVIVLFFIGLFAFSSVQSLSHVQLFVIPCTAAHQASLSITNSWSLLKLVSIELVMPSNHLILCFPLLFLPSIFPNIRVFSSASLLCIRWPVEVSASVSVLSMNIQD